MSNFHLLTVILLGCSDSGQKTNVSETDSLAEDTAGRSDNDSDNDRDTEGGHGDTDSATDVDTDTDSDSGADTNSGDDTAPPATDCAEACGQNLSVRLRETWGATIATQNAAAGYDWSDAEDVANGIMSGFYPPVPAWQDVSVYPQAYNDATWYLNKYSWNWCCSALDWPAEYHSPAAVTIHHTAGSFGTCDEYVTWAYNFHTFGQDHGWGDIGYQLLVCEEAGVVNVYEGRFSGSTTPDRDPFGSIWVVGAHVTGYNTGNVGISLVGDFTTTVPSVDELEAMTRVTARVYYETGLADASALYGHRDLGSTECPGDQLYSQLDQVRDRIAWCQDECDLVTAAGLAPPLAWPNGKSTRERVGDNH